LYQAAQSANAATGIDGFDQNCYVICHVGMMRPALERAAGFCFWRRVRESVCETSRVQKGRKSRRGWCALVPQIAVIR
jgi:hypothetical protein